MNVLKCLFQGPHKVSELMAAIDKVHVLDPQYVDAAIKEIEDGLLQEQTVISHEENKAVYEEVRLTRIGQKV
jgi:DNA-binding HxlR family transcriptional regulator